MTSPEVHGVCDERFAAVRQVFEGNFANGLEAGASVAVTVDGEFVVDLWGGVADVDTGRPWERDTIVNVWSSTKTMVALVALELADRGVFDLHAPVATYWPEFAAAGKEGIEVRHVLGHTAGLSGWRDPMTVDGLYDLPTANSLLAAQAPLWEPGTASGYHAITEGHLMGEIVRRVTGVSFGEYFRTTFAEPLGADFQIGVGATDDARVATIVPPSFPLGGGVDLEVGSIPHMTLCNPVVHATISATEAFRRAELPAANGHGNARSMARVQSIVSNGGVLDGHRFLSEAGIEALFEEQACGVDLVQAVPLRLGVGYGINGPELPVSPNPRACYWGGWGGSIVLNDLDANVTFAYAMNRMGEGSTVDFRGVGLALAMHTVLMA